MPVSQKKTINSYISFPPIKQENSVVTELWFPTAVHKSHHDNFLESLENFHKFTPGPFTIYRETAHIRYINIIVCCTAISGNSERSRMGNNIGGRKKAKVMKINGETFKLKTPVRAWDVVKDYPGYVLLDSEAVKHFGIRAKPLEQQQELKPKKTYFLVELPRFPEEKAPRRVRSGIQMTAKDRLECLMLSRRSVSDLAVVRPAAALGPSTGPMKVKMRLPKAQVEKLMEDSKDGAEVAERILGLYMENTGDFGEDNHREAPWRPALGSIRENLKAREKRVSFVPQEGEEICLASQ